VTIPGFPVEVASIPLIIGREAQQLASRERQPSLAGDLADFSGELAVIVVGRVRRRRFIRRRMQLII
jgi:hypothetical protein